MATRVTVTGLGFVFLILSAAAADLVEEKEYRLETGAAISINAAVGKVRIRGTEKTVANLKTIRRGPNGAGVTFDINSDSKKFALKAQLPQGGNLSYDLEIELSIPADMGILLLETSAGSIEVSSCNVQNTIINVASGSVTVAELNGNLSIVSNSGNVSVSELKSEKVEIEITSGDLKGSGNVRNLILKNISGNMNFDLAPPADVTWSVKSSSVASNLTLSLPENAGATLKASSQAGSITCDYELKGRTEKKSFVGEKSLHGAIGNGIGTIQATCVAGSIAIKRQLNRRSE